MRTRTLGLCLAMLLPLAAFPQFDFGGGDSSSKPWEGFKLNSKTRVKLDYRNASIDNILSFYQKQTGITIVKDPSLTGALTITSAAPVSLDQALQILRTTLSLKNFDLRKENGLLVIKARPQSGGRGNAQGAATPDMTQIFQGGFPGGGQSQSELRVYQVQYASASAVARVINDVFASTSQGGFQFPFGMAGGMRGGPGNNRFGNMMQRFGQTNQQTVKASSDDFSNSVIVNAAPSDQIQVASIIKQIDKITDQPQASRVYKLQFADANDMATTIQNVLVQNAPTGRGQSSTTQNGPGNFFRSMFGQNQAQVVADTRTNSIVVTATEQNHAVVKQVVAELDKEVPVQTSTIVIPLDNARAEDLASVLTNAFGQRQGTNSNRTSTTNRSNNSGSVGRGTNLGGNSGRSSLGGQMQDPNLVARSNADPNSLPVDLADPNAASGELMTSVGVVQGGGFGFFGGQNNGRRTNGTSSNSTTTARDESGRLVNVQDLTGQVSVIADPATNSLIIVANPDAAQIVKSIVEQLDRIPEQVMIEAMIVEVTLGSEQKLGLEWSLTTPNLGSNGVTGSGGPDFGIQRGGQTTPNTGLIYSVTGGNLSAYLQLLKSDTKFNVLSTPRIFTSNHQQAEINVSQSLPYITSTRYDTNGNPTYSYGYEDVGIVLTVTPSITSNGYVTMDVNQTANDLQGYTTFNAPIINQRITDTSVSVMDGRSIVLGGIMRDTISSTVNKVPLLGDLPLLGNLFRSTHNTKDRTELLVFLTPHVVRNPDDARKLREDYQKKFSKEARSQIEKGLPPQQDEPAGTSNGGNSG